MMRARVRPALLAGVMMMVASPPARAAGPATAAEAAKVVDLATLPVMPGAKVGEPRRLASLSYVAKGDPRGAFAFVKKTLEAQGWKELPGGSLGDGSCSGAFGKAGFTLAASAYPPGGPGMVQVNVNNLGNVPLPSLPVPEGAKVMYGFPSAMAYVTPATPKETAEALRALLTAQGWQPYGRAGDGQFFKKNAVRLSAVTMSAPAQGGKTTLQLSTELMSVDLPAPPSPALLDAHYADTTKGLGFDAAMTPEALVAFYREALGKAGWKPTTDAPAKVGFESVLVFRNAAKDLAFLKMHPIDGKLRGTLTHQTLAEFEESMRLADAAEAGRKAGAAEFSRMAAAKAAKDRVHVAIALPEGAKDVTRDKDDLAFKLPPGGAKAAVEIIRASLLKAGWTLKAKPLDPTAGSLSFKGPKSAVLNVVYIDAGLGDAEVKVSAFGAELANPEAN